MIPRILDRLSNSVPNKNWITDQSGLPWLALDITVPHKQIYQEWLKVSHLSVPHRDSDLVGKTGYTHRGWRSLTLHGVAPDITEQSDLVHGWTGVADRCPITKSWLEEHFVIAGAKRIRFMLLEAGGYILPHADTIDSRLGAVNTAITNPEGTEFHMLHRGKLPFRPGRSLMLDLSNQHWVVNRSDQPRLHIIVHAAVQSNIVEKSYANLCNRD